MWVGDEEAQREAVVATALTWQNTPYRHMGRIKGVGADCLTFIAEVYHEAGLIPKIEIPFYPQDWMHHRESERYLEGLLQHTREIETDPLPGDIVLWRCGRCFSHGAIVLQWPHIIHAQIGCGVLQENAEQAAWLTHVGENTTDKGKIRLRKAFSYWGR